MPSRKLTPKFLTESIAKAAVEEVVRMVMGLANRFPVPMKRRQCHVVVLVPSISENAQSAEAHILYEYSYNKSDWVHPYDDIARSKALQLWQERNDDRTDSMPHLLFSGDTPFWGGVKRHGIVVTCSGVKPWFDKMISGMVADCCNALAYEAWMTSEDRANGVDFLS